MNKPFRIALVLALIVVLGTPAVSAAAGRDHHVPIKAALSGLDSIDPTAPGCPAGTPWSWRFTSVGTGNMSHLGRVHYTLSHCTVGQEGRFALGTITITAPNGDTLVLSEQGTFTVPVPGDPPPFAILSLTWEVVDGSGRFEHATGSGSGTGRTDIPGGFTDLQLHGHISYDASDRSGR